MPRRALLARELAVAGVTSVGELADPACTRVAGYGDAGAVRELEQVRCRGDVTIVMLAGEPLAVSEIGDARYELRVAHCLVFIEEPR